jgi:heterodisulfide reductase subunit A-like polyferredoxin
MAKSICARCGESAFEQATVETGDKKGRVTVLQCAKCGAVAGTLGTGSQQLQEAKLDQISEQAHRIDAGLRAIVEALNKR